MVSADEQGAAGPQAVGGLLPEVWAELFQRQEHLLDPVLPWLRQQLEAIYGSQWWLARSAESTILHALCIRGLDGDAMVQMMQDYLEEYTEELVHGVISIIVSRCREEAQSHLFTLLATSDTEWMAMWTMGWWGSVEKSWVITKHSHSQDTTFLPLIPNYSSVPAVKTRVIHTCSP
ncbi:hypothetical protein Q9966_014376 [Columba livia]|nr:hypothetical protein Q9966_014376 [Columba livia]